METTHSPTKQAIDIKARAHNGTLWRYVSVSLFDGHLRMLASLPQGTPIQETTSGEEPSFTPPATEAIRQMATIALQHPQLERFTFLVHNGLVAVAA